MSEIQYKGGKIRMEAYQKLKVFLVNPGRFCLVVLGSRGVGKHFAIESAFSEIKITNSNELCLNELVFVEASSFPETITDIDQLFEKNKYNTLVIEDVDDLSFEQQKLLFTALSTTDGTFGINEKNIIRIVFTSSKDNEVLRTDNVILNGKLWDRISQLIIEIPSFKIESDRIVGDFKATWEKMNFEKTINYKHFANVPKNAKLEKFLEDNASKFEGGFRDLDKIACLYFNYRIYHYENKKKIIDELEDKVVLSVKNDFFSKYQMLGDNQNDLAIFRFEVGFSHQELLKKYKIQLRKWAVKQHKTVKDAEKKLEFKPGTMKNYVDSKV